MALLGYSTPVRSGAFLSPTYKKAPRIEGESEDAYQFRTGKQNQTEFKNVIAPITPAGTTAGGNTAGKSADSGNPFKVLINVKDPLIDTAAVNALKGVQDDETQVASMFGNYLAKLRKAEAPAEARMANELKTYDTAANRFREDLASNIKRQDAGFYEQAKAEMAAARLGDERFKLGQGALAGTRDGESERTFNDSYNRIMAQYRQSLGNVERQNILAGAEFEQQVAPRARIAEQQYLASLLTPATATSALRSDALRNLNAASAGVANNRFYTAEDTRGVPNIGVPQASYRLPQTPNYGAYPSPQARYDQPRGGGGGGGNRPSGTSTRSRAEIDYRNDTGYWPQEDPNFNTMLYESYGGRIGSGQSIQDARAQQVDEAVMRGVAARERWSQPVPVYDFGAEMGYYEQPGYQEPIPDWPSQVPFNAALGGQLQRDWNNARVDDRANLTVPNYTGRNFQLGENNSQAAFPLNY